MDTTVFLLGMLANALTELKMNLPVQTPIVYAETASIQEKIYVTAKNYGVSGDEMYRTIECESQFNPSAIGDNNKSFGLVQIHLPSHPSITKEEALNENYAISFMAKEFQKGNKRIWTCYRQLYPDEGD